MQMVQVCMKLMGSILIVIGGTIGGWYYGNRIQKRYEALLNWKRIFQIIQTDISYGGMNLFEIIQHIKRLEKGEIHKLFAYIETAMKQNTYECMEEMWKKGIQIYAKCEELLPKDVEELIKITSNLGCVEKSQQLMLIQLYVNHLELQINEMEVDKNKKRKLCQTLGILGSIFLVILLI